VIINLYKPVGWTSFDVCKKIRSITKEKKVGHGGTLDPFAEGVLIIGTGFDTKKLSSFTNEVKSYDALLNLGSTTDTLDNEGKISLTKEIPHFSENDIINCFSSYIGDYYQTPPMYSAKKIKGKKLYEYARNNIEVRREPVLVKIYSLSLNFFDSSHISFSVKCSKGTYVRVLGNDIAESLGTVGYLNKLVRTSVGKFSIEKSQTIERFTSSWKLSMKKTK